MSVGFNLRGIRTEQFAMFEDYFVHQQAAQVGHSFKFMLNPNLKQLGTFAHFDFKQNDYIIMKIVVSCHFGIDPKTWDSFKNNGKITLPQDFITNLAMITSGVARGILAVKTENTPFSNYLLPLLDITNIIKSDVTFHVS